MILLLLAVSLSAYTPGGARVTARNAVDLPVAVDVLPGAFLALQEVRRHSDLTWIGFAIDHEDTAYTWPKGDRFWVVLKDGRQVRDSLALACEPAYPPSFTMRPTHPLGTVPVRLEPEVHWRKRFPWGRVCTVALVGFPYAFSPSEISEVRIGDATSSEPHRTAADKRRSSP